MAALAKSSSSGAALSWTNICYSEISASKEPVAILDNLSGSAVPGSCLAILGPSGAGKTSLLNVISGKLPPHKYGGHVKVNGQPLRRGASSVSLVEQADLFIQNITVREHMEFHARLRLWSLGRKERWQKVDAVLSNLGLNDALDRLIMFLSGGEKKRLAVAEELLNNPSVLLLDEPTSQLDSHMASTVVSALTQLSQDHGKTVLFTIHQPSTALYNSFGSVMFLAGGRLAYSGEPAGLVPAFEVAGYQCPAHFNPAEFALELLSDKTAASAVSDSASKHKPVLRNTTSEAPAMSATTTAGAQQTYAPWWVEYIAVCRRTFLQRKRQRLQTRMNYINCLIISLLAGSLNFSIDSNQASIHNRVGAVFFLFVHPVFSAIFETAMPLVLDAPTLLREYKTKRLYRVSTYYAARTTGELPFQLSFPIIYCTIIYWMVGFDREDVTGYFGLLATLLLACFTGTSYGYMLSTFSVDFELSMSISVVFLVLIFLFSGMLSDDAVIPVWMQWISNISLFKWAFNAGIISVFRDVEFRCDPGEECTHEDGMSVLSSYNISGDVVAHQQTALLMLLILSFGARLIGFFRIYLRYVFEDDWRALCCRRRKAAEPAPGLSAPVELPEATAVPEEEEGPSAVC